MIALVQFYVCVKLLNIRASFLLPRVKKMIVKTSRLLSFVALALLMLGPTLIQVGASPTVAVGAVYTEDNAVSNHVWRFTRYSDGTLGPGVSYSTGGAGTGVATHSQGAIALTADGKWLLATDAGSNQISVFWVTSTGLVLKDVEGSRGKMPISLTVSDSWVYVLDAGTLNIAGFRLRPWGELTYISGSWRPLGSGASSPEQIGFITCPERAVLAVTDKGSGKIYTYAVNYWGVAGWPKTTTSSGPGTYGFASTKDDLIVSEAGDHAASSYDVSRWGALTPISKSVSTTGLSDTPCWVAVTCDGKLAYTGNGGSGTVSSFRVGWDGSLTLISANAAGATYAPSLDLAFSSGDGFIYLLSANSGNLEGFQVNHSTGALTWVTTVSIPTSAAGIAAS